MSIQLAISKKRGDVMKDAIVIIIVLFFFVGVNHAEMKVDPTIEFLIDDKVSMLDWGLFRLERQAENILGNIFDNDTVAASTDLTSDGNYIFLSISLIGNKPDKDIAKKDCVKAIEVMRQIFTTENINGYFKHAGYKSRDEPKYLGNKIRDLIFVVVEAHNYEKGGSVKKTGHCSSSLLESHNIDCH